MRQRRLRTDERVVSLLRPGLLSGQSLRGEYVIGAPQVARATFRLAGGKVLEMTAKDLSEKNMYVKSVTLNGKRIVDCKLRHGDVMKGGEVVFEMFSRP